MLDDGCWRVEVVESLTAVTEDGKVDETSLELGLTSIVSVLYDVDTEGDEADVNSTGEMRAGVSGWGEVGRGVDKVELFALVEGATEAGTSGPCPVLLVLPRLKAASEKDGRFLDNTGTDTGSANGDGGDGGENGEVQRDEGGDEQQDDDEADE